ADGMGAGGHCGFPCSRSSSTHARPRVSATNRKVSNGGAGEVSRMASSRSNSRDRMWSSRAPTSFQISTYRVSSGRPTCWKTPPPTQPGRARVTSHNVCSARAVSASCPAGRVMSRMVITSSGDMAHSSKEKMRFQSFCMLISAPHVVARACFVLLRKEKLDLDAQLPGGRVVRPADVGEGLERRVHREVAELAQVVSARQLLQPEQLASSGTQGHGPLVPAARHPVGRQDGRAHAGTLLSRRYLPLRRVVLS